MMGDRRRHSPEGSSRRSRKESSRSEYRSEYDDTPRMRPGANEYLSSSAGSSSSYELIDISRTYPSRSGLRTFFTAPSERKLRRRRSSRLFKLNNSSSSSVNSDLAYGTGYLKAHKRRGVRSRKGKEIDRESGRYSRESQKHSYSDRERFSGSERRGNSNAEILAVGAGLAKLARDQNKLDLKNARNGKKPEVYAVKENTHGNNGGSRGLGASRISHGSDTFDEEGWESATDAESDFSVDSRLAFGEENGWGWGKQKHGPLSRKDSVVDPKLFGPNNSLHGIITQPVGFDDVTWTSSSDFGQGQGLGQGQEPQRSNTFPIGRNESLSGSQTSLQKVYPIPTTDPSRFEAARSSVASGSEPYISSRPGPAPLQHPQPFTPVSQSIYEPSYTARSESGGILKKTQPPPSSRSKSLAEAALVGVAGAAVGAAIVSNRNDDRKDRYQDDEIREEDRLKRRDSDKRESKDERRRGKRDSPDRDDRKDKRREKDRQKESSRYSSDESRREKKREKRRESGRDDGKDEKREKRREERRSARSDISGRDDRYDDRRTKSEAAISTVSTVDPFMFQVDDNDFPTPTAESSNGHRRIDSVPTVVTVEREPDFTRKRSSSIKALPSDYKPDSRNEYPWDEKEQQRQRDSRDHTFQNAESIYQETEHSTAPISAAAIGAAVGAVAAVASESSRTSRSDKRRDERRSGRSDYDDRTQDTKSRGREPERDPIQEEADKAYREIVMARKIASQVIRSRSASPDPSVVKRYDQQEEEEIIRIVTPPGMEDHKKKGPYDAPNADFRPDYEIEDPRLLRNFSIPTINQDRSNSEVGYLKRDPDATKPRPLLNLVHPTPTPSPLPEKQAARSETSRSSKSKDKNDSSRPETARSEPARSSKSKDRDESSRSETGRSSKSRDREDTTRSESARSEPARSSKSKDREDTSRSETGRSEPARSSKSRDREDTTRSESARSEPARSSKSKDREDTSRSETGRSEPDRSSKSKDREDTSRPEAAWSELARSSKKDREDTSRSETAWSEPARSSKSKDREKTSSSEISRSSKSKDRDESSRSETAWSEPVRSNKAKDREEQVRSSASDVVSSPTSKGVTWGQNETKHFEVESPSDHKEEFISNSEVKAQEDPAESKQSTFGGWGAIAAGIVGVGAGAAAASSSETSKKSTLKETEKKQDNPYEYRGVVVEPESPPRRRSPPSAGPKPTKGGSSRVPGAFDDDLDFTATVAAGLQDTGFDPNIVIEDPTFRRRDSPPGSNEPGVYRAPYSETVSDLGAIPTNASGVSGSSQGFVMGEVASTPRDWPSVSPDYDDSAPKLSKKEQKKRDKAAKRQSDDIATFEETPPAKAEEPHDYFEPTLSKKEQKKRNQEAKRQSSLAEDITPIAEPSTSRDFVEEPESYAEPSKKSKKKSKRDSINFDDVEEASAPEVPRDGRKVSVPVDAFDDLRNEDDEWAQPKSKKKSKRDSDRYDSPARSVPPEASSELERSSSKKSKDKSKRKNIDQYEPDPAEVSLPPSTPSETSRDGDHEDRKSRKASSRDSGIFGSTERDDSRSVVSSRYDDEPRKSKKKSRSSTKDDFDDTRSVASAPAGDFFEDSKRSKKDKKSSGGFFGLFGSKSESGARDDSPKRSKDDFEDAKKKKKSKRSSMPDASSLYGDIGATSVNDLSRSVSNGHGSRKYDDDLDNGVRSDGERKKTRSRAESTSSKKDSFLDKAGTLGAGVGIAGAAVAIAAQHHQQLKADNAYDELEHRRSSRSGNKVQKMEDELDPEIKRREFRPSIDPQYGDLLPLPPSSPASPNVESLDDLPDLPDSGPETPEAERVHKEKSRIRRSIQDAPMKSPSHSAVPLKFIMGNRSNPSSPGLVRSSPAQSPSIPSQDPAAFSRNRHRPTSSWDSAREYKPLYLVESNRRSSQILATEEETPLPELPPSQRTSRSSSQLDSDDEAKGLGLDFDKSSSEQHAPARQLSIDTGLASSDPSAGLLDSQQSTPKAGLTSHDLEERFQPLGETASKAIATAGLVSTIGYFASSPSNRTAKENWMDDLPSVQRQPPPVESMTKDRSSYLLRSSPMSMKDDIRSEDYAMDSPLRTKSTFSANALHSTEEPEGQDIFDSEKDPQQDTLVENSPLAQLPREAEQIHDEAEPADEFSLSKSKKDKKKDKKKGKGPSRSSTQDDTSLTEPTTSVDLQPPTPADIEPEEEFSMTKSKKDKKKGKKNGKATSSWEAEDEANTSQPLETPLVQESQGIVKEPVAISTEPSEEFSMPNSKKDKKKGKLTSSWEDEASTSQPLETPLVQENRDVVEELAPVDVEPSEEFSMPKSKKDKKKDKKKGKSFSSWEPEEEATPPQPTAESLPENSREIVEEPPITAAAEPSEEFASVSKKNKKKDKKKGKSAGSSEPEQDEYKPSVSQEDNFPETSQDINEETAPVPDDFQTPGTKKSKKDKRKSVTWQPDEELAVPEPTSPPKLDLEQESAQEVLAADDFGSFSRKKSKKAKNGKSTIAWEPETEVEIPESSSREFQPEDSSLEPATEEFEDAQEFVIPDSKKNKKKGKKSQSLGPEETFDAGPVLDKFEESTEKSATVGQTEDQPLTDKVVEEPEPLVIPGSKKSKKSKKAQSIALEETSNTGKDPEESVTIGQMEDQPFTDKAIEEPEQFVIPGSKKNKKQSKKSQAWEEDPEPPVPQMDAPAAEKPLDVESFAPIPAPEAPEEFTMPSSKKGKKKSRKSQTFDIDEEARSESLKEDGEKSTEAKMTPEVSSNKATSLDAPTPATPFATAEEFPASPNSGYFPSATSLHSPEKLQVSEDPQSQGYFPSSMAILPVAVAGVAALAAHRDEKDVSRPNDLDSAATASEMVDQKPAPDGLAAGYDNDQLSLAKQLQEEFGSGSKKSKKDKKKRQSLPSTPDPESSRSRNVDDTSDSHPRARSLSIGPATESAERKNLYSEDQLELARQLKADFEKGSKKSKKDKKKRGDSSGPSTRDNTFDQGLDEPATKGAEVQDNTPTPGLEDETPKGDGLAAGYQEEQLSLARQLQAEFGGSGSKKSKKDKKRRSTSQTPLEQETPGDDYFGASAQAPVLDAPSSQEPANISEASPANEVTRDGLAVGYKEEQLELARQLKEEFGSGSKSKKGKKDKKRQSVGRTNTDDDFSSTVPPGEAEGSLERDALASQTAEAGPTDPQIAEPEDEFAFAAKKSKKDKKGKKSENLIRTATEESLPSEAQEPRDTYVPQPETVETRDADIPQPEVIGTRDADAPQPEIVQEATPENVQPVDDFEFTSKKSKKDKKSKKRDSLSRGTTDDSLNSDDPAKESDALDAGTSQPETVDEPSQEFDTIKPADEFEFTAKKSKKDKKSKKRDNLGQSTLDENIVQAPAPSADKPREVDISQQEIVEEPYQDFDTAKPADEFEFTAKKSKKDKKSKKRENLGQSTPDENVVPEAPVPSADEPREVDISQPETIASEEVLPKPEAEPVDDFAFPTKKSKKDKKGKKRESLSQTTPDEPVVLEAPVPSADRSPEPDISQPEPSQEIIREPEAAEPVDEFAFTTKKSKKDKKGKKKESSAPTNAPDETAPDETARVETAPVEITPIGTTPIDFGQDVEALHNARDVDSEDIVATPSELPPAEDDWAVPAQKSKKDKKKRQSLPSQDDPDQLHSGASPAPTPASEEPSTAVSPAIEPVSEPAEDFSFTSKKSKKSNKKRQSLQQSSTFDETPEQQVKDQNLEVASSSQDIKDIATLPSAEQDDGFESTSKKSKKDKKKGRQNTPELSPTEDVSGALQEPVSIEQGDEVTTQAHDPVLSLEDSTQALDSSSREPALDEETVAQPAPDAPQGESENLFDEFSFSKKSKKDKKKRKDSSKPSSEEVSGISTPLDPLAETKEEPTESSTSKEAEQEKPSVVAEILDPAPKVDAEGTGVWDAFSTKKSKKDKKKKNTSQDTSAEPSGISTPLDSAPHPSIEVPEANPQYENVPDKLTPEEPLDVQLDSEAPATPQDVAEEPEQDAFFSNSKKSKKDKKKRKSGLSTPIETVPETSVVMEEPVKQEQSTSEQVVDGPTVSPSAQEAVEEPEQDEWASLSNKKSKKDKKKRQSGLSTPAEDTRSVGEPASVIAPLAAIATKEILDESVKSEESPARVASQDTIQEPDDNEWGSFSTKKSKKDKKTRKSGLATPIEEIIDNSGPSKETIATEKQILSEPEQDVVEDPKLEDLPTSTDTREIVDEPSAPPTLQEAEEPADEWSSSLKKSKKDKKKRKSGLSTPVEEVSEKPIETAELSTPAPEIPEEPAKVEESAPTKSPEVFEEPIDDRAPISQKQSKKDKKHKSGLSTPAEEVPRESVEPEPSISAATRDAVEESAKNDEPVISVPSKEVAEEPVDDWASTTTKKSKKDKKRKSGLSTPGEEIQARNVAVEEPRDLSIDSTVPPPSGEFESIEASDKPKDKTIEGPIEQDSGVAYAQEIVDEPVNLEESPLPSSSQDPTQAPGDEWGAFSTKKSKKDKKRKSGLSTPLEETSSSTEPQKHLESERSVEQPSSDPLGGQVGESFVQPLSEKLDDKDVAVEDDNFGFAKKSKKDKKKRGSRLDSETAATNTIPKDSPIIAESSREQGPSIAPEHLVANPVDIEQMRPSLKDKSRDALTSSSPPTSEPVGSEETDTFPADLSRKSSKKDKRKRQATIDTTIPGDVGPAKAALTSWADEVEEAEVERKLPVIEDIAKDESLSHIALTTEASPVDDFLRPTKKGKKGKKKNTGSIGSPSMAESFRPPIGEDVPKEHSDENSRIPGLAAAGAAALAGAAILSKSGGKESEPSTSVSGASTPARKLSKKEKRKMSIDHRAPRDDMFDDPALWEGADPKEFEESRGQEKDYDGDDGFWSPPGEEQPHANPASSHELSETSREPEHPHEETSQAPPTPPTMTTSNLQQPVSTPLGLTDIPPLSHQNASTPSESINQSQDRGVDFEEQPFDRTPSRKSRYNTGFSDLPVVREESPIRHESDHQVKRGHYEDDANRDSAFVTESPIPPQGAFADVHDEHVRDSGVHMRDISPAGEVHARAPVSSSDDAIASLAWPQVDEEAETVAIEKSLRPKVVTDKHRREEKSSRSSHDSHEAKEDRNIDFFQAQRPADERVDKHHDEKRPSIDLLPSQRDKEEKHTDLHRTRTIHKSEERPKHHDEEFASRDIRPSQREEEHTGLHRTQTIHGSAEERPRHHEQDIHPSHREEHAGLHRSDTIHGSRQPSQGSLVKQRVQRLESSDNLRSAKPKDESDVKQRVQRIKSPDSHRSSKPKEEKYAVLGQAQIPKAERPKINETTIAAGTAAIGAAGLGFAAARQLSAEKRPDSAQSHKSTSNINRLRTPDPKFRSDSANSHRSGTPPLRRSDRKISGDLRSLSQRSQLDLAKEAELAALSNSSSTVVSAANPQANEGRVRAKDMADVYDGFGEGRMGSPRSPTRPHSMRRRQSMQVLDLESKLEQLAAENRILAEAKAQAERTLKASGQGSISVVEKDAEIDSLKRTLDWLQNEVTRLTEVNDGLASANATIGQQHSERYGTLEAEHAQATRELQETRDAHSNLSGGMEGIVRNEIQRSVQEKDEEIAQLRAQLESAKEQIREMQRQILASKAGDSDFLTIRDEDYFDNACQQLCQHVQQWVLRFSKFSDMRACRLTSEINNDKTIDRLDNAILDGSDVDSYLADRIKRRDVFMSMTMTMVWEFIFTRYLFGMDREQRQKLKSLEKLLSEVGPAAAVHQWRATTLTLLSRREAFIQQREQDTEAVVHAILETLSEILPPPSHLEAQIDEQLKRVMKAAVNLSIEMRTQRAEYMMLPPLQPEYDANGDLASKVSFNAALMNERSGDTVSNEELEAQKAVVRVVLFPLVVKKGDDSGEGDEEIVVCPAQVLVAKPKKSVRVFSPEDMAANHSRMSLQSSMPGGEGSVI